MQAPPAQSWPVPQTLVAPPSPAQPPQLVGSVCVSTQKLVLLPPGLKAGQAVRGAGQVATQAPLAQAGVAPLQFAPPQLPQLAGSDWTSSQAPLNPPQLVPAADAKPGRHSHVPLWHHCDAPQTAPPPVNAQPPQFAGSEFVSTHVWPPPTLKQAA